ncbi:IS5 family transposase [Limnoglobus roseus]|uniref:IS5 family transposase n=1 Tax=Limnoglobus roseus TaxID=2598579 RepID=UPI0036F352DF
MRRHELSDADWAAVRPLLPARGPAGGDHRAFVNAVLYVLRTGVPWRDLPPRFGNWNSVWRRFRRWSAAGVWGRVLEAVRDPDVSTLILDSTVVRAHPHAAGAGKKAGDQAVGRSPGGFGTKVHAAVTGRGHPVALLLTPGQAGDGPRAAALLAGHRPRVVIADRGYDSDALRRLVRRLRAKAVIRPLGCRRRRVRYDRRVYRTRNVVERFWARVKQCRRVATRYDKLDQCYLGFVHLASALDVLRHP